ncbi:MAG: nucleoside hydrolase [Armatimonadota bacterium]|jgi:inosine-uridine nucleoside N-ribohydrolase
MQSPVCQRYAASGRPSEPSRRGFLRVGAAAGAALALSSSGDRAASAGPYPTAEDTFGLLKAGRKIPVIFDTDIGSDIDDTWALCMVLRCPELDVRLVVSDKDNSTYRARILAKMLDVFERTDIPVGVGLQKGDEPGRQSAWTGDYDLARYPGTVHEDGVGAIIQTIKDSPEPMSLVCTGPVPNIAAALEREPGIVEGARFVGMHGSVRRGYRNNPKISAEANVRNDPGALQKVFAAPWDVTITPLDTCGIIRLTGEKFAKVHQCEHPAIRALMENYRVWLARRGRPAPDPLTASSTLFDTVAVYLAFTEELLEMENIGLRVTDDGYTVIEEKARAVRCAMKWRNLGAFEDLLVGRLVGEG